MAKNCSQMITYYQCTFAKEATFFVDPVRIFNRAKFLLPCLLEESVQNHRFWRGLQHLTKFQKKRVIENEKTIRNKITGVIH